MQGLNLLAIAYMGGLEMEGDVQLYKRRICVASAPSSITKWSQGLKVWVTKVKACIVHLVTLMEGPCMFLQHGNFSSLGEE